MSWLLYGANGYSGVLIAEEAKRRGLAPVLAGRREEAIRPLAERLGLPWRSFALDDRAALEREVSEVAAVLLAAGPFSRTSRPVVDACLAARRHYLDVTGEIAVFEAVLARDAEARERGAVLLPGVGFDVVPSDCLAACLARSLPGATSLELAFATTGGRPSRGTTRTMLESLPKGGAIRKDGKIVQDPAFSRTRVVPFRDRPRHAVAIPWGDVSTAFFSTKIPNIVVYMAMSERAVRRARLARPLLKLAGWGPVQRLLDRTVGERAQGSTQEERESARSQLWGRAARPLGEAVEGTLEAPEGYKLTAIAAVEAVERVAGGAVGAGAHTPSTAFGAGFVGELPGCDLRVP